MEIFSQKVIVIDSVNKQIMPSFKHPMKAIYVHKTENMQRTAYALYSNCFYRWTYFYENIIGKLFLKMKIPAKTLNER